MHRVSTTLQRGTALMIYNIARGNTTKARRTKEDEFEPEDDDRTGVHNTDASYDSEIDLSEESASDSDAECDGGAPGEPEAEPGPDICSSSTVKFTCADRTEIYIAGSK